jgi:hypothetical protein
MPALAAVIVLLVIGAIVLCGRGGRRGITGQSASITAETSAGVDKLQSWLTSSRVDSSARPVPRRP